MLVYVARDRDGEVRLHGKRPERLEALGLWDSGGEAATLAGEWPRAVWREGPVAMRLVAAVDAPRVPAWAPGVRGCGKHT